MRNYSSRAFYHIIENPDIIGVNHEIIKDILNVHPEVMYYMIYDIVDSNGLKESTVIYTYTIHCIEDYKIFPFHYIFYPTRDSIYYMERLMSRISKGKPVKHYDISRLFYFEKGGWLTALHPFTEFTKG